MPKSFLLFKNVSFRYPSMPDSILHNFSCSFASGWTGVVGANGAGKSTILRLASGLLHPVEGLIQIPGGAVYCAQRTDDAPGMLQQLLDSNDRGACEMKGQLGIGADWLERWASLSHGERKRAQIAVLLWQEPAVAAIDEPTNHIDSNARAMLATALRGYQGIGILVSHDRELLDALCRQCLFINPPDAVLRPGNYSSGRQESISEEKYAYRRKQAAKRNALRLQEEAQRRAARAQDAERRNSKSRLDPRDHDGKARIDGARLTGADGRAAKSARMMQSRVYRATLELESIKIKKEYELGIWIESEKCKRNTLLRLDAGSVPLGNARELSFPGVTIVPGDRIALTGSNGAGKSTFIRHLLAHLDLPPERLTYLPQEIDMASSCEILANVRSQPGNMLGKIMTVVSRLGSRPARLLESIEPSPGELRKLLLALGIARHPYLIVMDEPTNHLDLPSIECLEEALEDCPGSLLLVSHDERFLNRLTRVHWHIEPDTNGNTHLRVV